MKIKRKSNFTIMELMIWIFIISIIGGVMTHNMKGSLTKGRSFKTETAGKQAYDILSLQMCSGSTMKSIIRNPGQALKQSGLVQNPKKLLQDGWGKNFAILPVGDDDFILYSKAWVKYLTDEKGLSIEKIEEEFPWGYNSAVISQLP